MTLEEIKAEIKERLAQTNVKREEQESKVDVPDYFSGLFDGVANGFDQVLVLLDQLEPSWHEYPREKPTEDGAYLITRYTKHGGVFIDIDSWISEYEMFDSTEDIPSSMKVLAWMELPKPYRKEETNG